MTYDQQKQKLRKRQLCSRLAHEALRYSQTIQPSPKLNSSFLGMK